MKPQKSLVLKGIGSLHLLFLLPILLLISPPALSAQKKTKIKKRAKIKKLKKLPDIITYVGEQEVDAESICFTIPKGPLGKKFIPIKKRLGLFTAKINWIGMPTNLNVVLKKRGDTRIYKQVRDHSPSYLQFDFHENHLRGNAQWFLVLYNYDSSKSVSGVVQLYSPKASQPIQRSPAEEHELIPSRETSNIPTHPDRSDWGEGIKKLLPDSTLRVDYPNGNYMKRKLKKKSVTYYIAESDSLFTVPHIVVHINVQSLTNPMDLQEFTDIETGNVWLKSFYEWLEVINRSLLQEIRVLLNKDPEMIAFFEGLEEGMTVFEKFTFRLEMVDEMDDFFNKE